MSDDLLRSFLDGHGAGQQDSRGEFTLDPRKALSSLGRFQLADPGLWVVKVAQAGVSLGASRIDCRLSYSGATLRFFDTPEVDAHEVARLFLSGELPGDGWKRHLLVGLRAFLGQSSARLSWRDGNGRTVSLHEGGLEVGQEAVSRKDRGASLVVVGQLSIIPRTLFRFNHGLRQTAAEHRALSDRLQLCHIPVILDGRTISRQFPPHAPQGLHQADYVYIALPAEGGDGFSLGYDKRNYSLMNLPASSIPGKGKLSLLKALVVLNETGYSHCYWVKDGALLNCRELFFTYSIDLYLDGRSQDVDLSEFAPLDPQVGFQDLARQIDPFLPDVCSKSKFDLKTLRSGFAKLRFSAY